MQGGNVQRNDDSFSGNEGFFFSLLLIPKILVIVISTDEGEKNKNFVRECKKQCEQLTSCVDLIVRIVT